MLNWPFKDPNEVLDFNVNWQATLSTGETITTSTVTVVEGSVIIDSQSASNGVVTVWLSGGVEGETCVLLNRIITSQGRTYDQSVRLRIKSK